MTEWTDPDSGETYLITGTQPPAKAEAVTKVDVEPFSDEPVMYGTPWGDLVPASALAAEQAKVRELVALLMEIENDLIYLGRFDGDKLNDAIAKYGKQK